MKKLTDGLKTLTGILLLFASVIVLGVSSPAPNPLNDSTLHLYTPSKYEEGYEKDWNQLKGHIVNTTAKTIILHVTGFGGQSNYSEPFFKAVREAQRQGKTIIMVAEQYAISYHAATLCYADNKTLTMEPNTFVYFHAAYYLKQRADGSFYKELVPLESQKDIFKPCLDNGILSLEDINEMMKGNAVIFTKPLKGEVFKTIKEDK